MSDLKLAILKINGNDVSNFAENEAIRIFFNAPGHIHVEVERMKTGGPPDRVVDSRAVDDMQKIDLSAKMETLKVSNQISTSTSTSASCPGLYLTLHSANVRSSKSTQTDDDDDDDDDDNDDDDDDNNFMAFATQRQLQNDTDIIEQEHNLFEQCLVAPEIDIEEVTLRKSDSNEILGLTVCYSGNGNGGGSGGSGNGFISSNKNANGINISCALSVSDDNETSTEVYISDIHPDSIAGRDGRLRQGDQILQINGKDVKNKEDTEALIAENNNAVTLLISRYMYTDEDDFNEPSVASLNVDDDDDDDDEVDDVDVYDDDDVDVDGDADEDDDDLYNVQNLPYENTLNDLVLMSQAQTKLTTTTTTTAPTLASNSDTKIFNSPAVKIAPLSSTVAAANSRECFRRLSKRQQQQQRDGGLTKSRSRKDTTASPSYSPSDASSHRRPQNAEYDVEHIYETIPEDSESEPFYCSPYESSNYVTAVGSCSSGGIDALHLQQQQKRRVAQWLGLKNNTRGVPGTAPRRLNCVGPVFVGRCASIGRTVANDSGSTSLNVALAQPLDGEENSSSAYNTGGSNNSNPQVSGYANNKDEDQRIGKGQTAAAAAAVRLLPTKEMKIASPKRQTINSKSMQQQSMLLDRHLLHQALTPHQPQPTQQPLQQPLDQHNQKFMKTSTQFTAPNLSQYHFVSSQEVSTMAHPLAIASTSSPIGGGLAAPMNDGKTSASAAVSEEGMVWKVKRRHDGSRYIVRRPAGRNRAFRERSSKQNPEQRLHQGFTTTTEDDTVSEVKAGRYWSKEERKKHIERARERRQQQQKSLCAAAAAAMSRRASFMTTMCIGDKAAASGGGGVKMREKAASGSAGNYLATEESSYGKTPSSLSNHVVPQHRHNTQPETPQFHSVPLRLPQLQHYQLQFSSSSSTPDNFPNHAMNNCLDMSAGSSGGGGGGVSAEAPSAAVGEDEACQHGADDHQIKSHFLSVTTV